MQNKQVLVVEDDVQISNFICYILKKEGAVYYKAEKGRDALEIFQSQNIDLILLDLGLPDMDGMDIIPEVRMRSEIPIIVLSARDQEKGKVDALDLGADDYLTKPFSVEELSARIRAAFRYLARIQNVKKKKRYQVGNVEMDEERHMVLVDKQEIHVTPLEFNVLLLLFQNAGKVLTTQYIMKEIYGNKCGTDTQALRTLIAGLRRKVEKNPGKPRYIVTENGVGYQLVDK